VDRRRTALALLVAFVVCTAIAIVVGKSRPALAQGDAPTVAQFLGYSLALVAALLLLAPGADGDGRRPGGAVLGALAVLVLIDLVADDGPDIGAGLVRLVGLLVIGLAMARLARGVTEADGSAP
jgi:hypothetical protein